MLNRLPRFKKRIRAYRGQRAGYGAKKKHRGKGSRGGKGWAGSTKHRRSYVYKYATDHFGYKGFRPPAAAARDVIINLNDVEKLAAKLGNDLDLTSMKYTKLLGRGKLSRPVTIKIASASEGAKAAVEAAGGKLVLEKSEESEE